VISFKDIEVARAARAAKEVIKGKGKRGRKRKSTIIEVDNLELDVKLDLKLDLELKVARATEEVINGKGKRRRKRKSVTLEANELELELEVARTIEALV